MDSHLTLLDLKEKGQCCVDVREKNWKVVYNLASPLSNNEWGTKGFSKCLQLQRSMLANIEASGALCLFTNL